MAVKQQGYPAKVIAALMSHIAFFQNGREGRRPLSEPVIEGGSTWEVGLNSNEDQVRIRYRPDEEKRASLVSRHRALTEEKHVVDLDRKVRVEKGRIDTETLQQRKDRAEARFKEINRDLHRIETQLNLSGVEDVEVFNLRELKDVKLWSVVGLEASDTKAKAPDAPAPVIEEDAPQGSEPSEPEADPLDEILAVIDQTVLDVTRRDFILADGETPEEIWKPLLEAKDLSLLEGTNVRDLLGTVSEDKFADVARHFKKLIAAEKARPKDEEPKPEASEFTRGQLTHKGKPELEKLAKARGADLKGDETKGDLIDLLMGEAK